MTPFHLRNRALKEGMDACKNHELKSSNPYPKYHDLFNDWLEGYEFEEKTHLSARFGL